MVLHFVPPEKPGTVEAPIIWQEKFTGKLDEAWAALARVRLDASALAEVLAICVLAPAEAQEVRPLPPLAAAAERARASAAHPRAYRGTKVLVPKLPDDVQETMHRAALTAFHALSLRDYARVDFRLTRDGKVYLIEANPNPYLSSGAEFIKGARASGRTYGQTILEIVELARARYAATPAAH